MIFEETTKAESENFQPIFVRLLRERIKLQGAITFRDWMNAARDAKPYV